MLNSIAELIDGFRKEFGDTVTVPGIGTPVPVQYSRKKRAQTTKEEYPKIIIHDYNPEFNKEYGTNYQKYVDGFHEFVDGVPTKAYEYEEPRAIIQRIDVTVFTKDPMQRLFLQDYFMTRFTDSGSLLFNTFTSDEGTVGDVIPYSVLPTEQTRTDGVFELNYEFKLKVFVQLADGVEVDLLESLTIEQSTKELPPSIKTTIKI